MGDGGGEGERWLRRAKLVWRLGRGAPSHLPLPPGRPALLSQVCPVPLPATSPTRGAPTLGSTRSTCPTPASLTFHCILAEVGGAGPLPALDLTQGDPAPWAERGPSGVGSVTLLWTNVPHPAARFVNLTRNNSWQAHRISFSPRGEEKCK